MIAGAGALLTGWLPIVIVSASSIVSPIMLLIVVVLKLRNNKRLAAELAREKETTAQLRSDIEERERAVEGRRNEITTVQGQLVKAKSDLKDKGREYTEVREFLKTCESERDEGYSKLIEATQQTQGAKLENSNWEWLRSAAGTQGQEIALHVELEKPHPYDVRLSDSIPSISFKFPVRNHSVLPVNLHKKQGKIYLNGRELADPIIVQYEGKNFGFRELSGLTLEQRLTPTEASEILARGGTFQFTDLHIEINGNSQFPPVKAWRLTITQDHTLVLGPRRCRNNICLRRNH